MAHEKSISIEIDGQHFNIPTVIRGKQVSDEEAVREFRRTGKNIGGPFKTQDEAVKRAKERSDSFQPGLRGVFAK